jgi:aryl-alcohol dehydrogenase-like predicted oxidoreductase
MRLFGGKIWNFAQEELVRAGKVRFPAISNYAAWQITEILWICEKRTAALVHSL